MKQHDKESVLHDWVTELPFTQQALLMLSMRGPDGLPKNTAAKWLLYYMRDAICKPAYEYDGLFYPSGFMRHDYDNFTEVAQAFFESVDEYPLHFILHLIHAAEVVGYSHPDEKIRNHWFDFYCYACESFHMHPETRTELFQRLKK